MYDNMKEPIGHSGEISQTEKDKYDFPCMWNLKNKINEQNRNRLRDTEQVDGCQRGGGLEDWVKKVKGLRSLNW